MPIEVKGLNHVYMQGTPFEAHALKDIHLTIRDGEFIGIIGHTGSGKSTLISHLNALDRPEPGTVFVNGVDLGEKGADLAAIRRTVGLVFQYPENQLVIGLAGSYREACLLAGEIVLDVLKKTGSTDIRAYLRDSGENI